MKMTRKHRRDLWTAFLSDQRLYGKSYPATENSRSEYQRDYDRIVFSSAFRRLQDKTQVFPLSQSDYTRTRLTHSLEASSVGRTLGVLAAKHLVKLGVKCEPHDLGTIVAAAGLAHDLGNPPFGHSGEAAIQFWAKRRLPLPESAPAVTKATLRARRARASSIPMTSEELSDFHLFEGNAQGLRISTNRGTYEKGRNAADRRDARRNGEIPETIVAAWLRVQSGCRFRKEARVLSK